MISSYISAVGGTSCTLSSCSILDSTGISSSLATINSMTTSSYNLIINTSTLSASLVSNSLYVKCLDVYGNS